MRPIDADKLLKMMSHWKPYMDMDNVREAIKKMPTLTPPNEPLTIEQLREMDGGPVYVVSAIGERPAWYIVDLEENELKNPWDRISLEDWDEGYPYTAYRRPPEGEV